MSVLRLLVAFGLVLSVVQSAAIRGHISATPASGGTTLLPSETATSAPAITTSVDPVAAISQLAEKYDCKVEKDNLDLTLRDLKSKNTQLTDEHANCGKEDFDLEASSYDDEVAKAENASQARINVVVTNSKDAKDKKIAEHAATMSTAEKGLKSSVTARDASLIQRDDAKAKSLELAAIADAAKASYVTEKKAAEDGYAKAVADAQQLFRDKKDLVVQERDEIIDEATKTMQHEVKVCQASYSETKDLIDNDPFFLVKSAVERVNNCRLGIPAPVRALSLLQVAEGAAVQTHLGCQQHELALQAAVSKSGLAPELIKIDNIPDKLQARLESASSKLETCKKDKADKLQLILGGNEISTLKQKLVALQDTHEQVLQNAKMARDKRIDFVWVINVKAAAASKEAEKLYIEYVARHAHDAERVIKAQLVKTQLQAEHDKIMLALTNKATAAATKVETFEATNLANAKAALLSMRDDANKDIQASCDAKKAKLESDLSVINDLIEAARSGR